MSRLPPCALLDADQAVARWKEGLQRRHKTARKKGPPLNRRNTAQNHNEKSAVSFFTEEEIRHRVHAVNNWLQRRFGAIYSEL